MKAVAQLLSLVFLATLYGCAGDHKDSQDNTLGAPPAVPTRAEAVAVPEVTHEEFDAAVKTIHSESQASNNALQQSFSGLGAQFGKIGEKVEANLVKFQTEFNTSLKAVAELSLKIHADLTSTIKAQASVDAQAIANLEAKLTATINTKFDALAQAQAQGLAQLQAGIGNHSETTQRTNTAGRDSVSTEFTKEMEHTILGIVGSLGGIILLLQERSRRRAEVLNGRFLDHHLPQKEKGEKPCEPGIVRRALRSLW